MATIIVDTGFGNLTSVQKALELAGSRHSGPFEVRRSRDPEVIRRADHVVVPGQGGFGEFSRALAGGLSEALTETLKNGTPFLGICLGLQILFESSDEAPDGQGLGWFRGRVTRLQAAPELKIPHMGWNQLTLHGGGHPFLEQAGGAGSWFYFVHSYHAVPSEPDVLRASVEYGPNQVTAAVARENVFATQFHPEKSQQAGLALLTAFVAS